MGTPSARPPAASTGREPRPPRTGTATWTAPCAPGSGPQKRSSPAEGPVRRTSVSTPYDRDSPTFDVWGGGRSALLEHGEHVAGRVAEPGDEGAAGAHDALVVL